MPTESSTLRPKALAHLGTCGATKRPFFKGFCVVRGSPYECDSQVTCSPRVSIPTCYGCSQLRIQWRVCLCPSAICLARVRHCLVGSHRGAAECRAVLQWGYGYNEGIMMMGVEEELDVQGRGVCLCHSFLRFGLVFVGCAGVVLTDGVGWVF